MTEQTFGIFMHQTSQLQLKLSATYPAAMNQNNPTQITTIPFPFELPTLLLHFASFASAN
eukprot:c18366_g1_i1 orf=2-178(-)